MQCMKRKDKLFFFLINMGGNRSFRKRGINSLRSFSAPWFDKALNDFFDVNATGVFEDNEIFSSS